jgi:hypothetical protein
MINPISRLHPSSPDPVITKEVKRLHYDQAALPRFAHLAYITDFINDEMLPVINALSASGWQGVLNLPAAYPAGLKNWYWTIGTPGQIGGTGPVLETGDELICITDNPGGTHAAVGADFTVVQVDITPATATDIQTGISNNTYVTPSTLTDQGFAFAVGTMTYNGAIYVSDALGTGAGNISAINDNDITLQGGEGTAGSGGYVVIIGGTATGVDNWGGGVDIQGASGNGTGEGGTVSIKSGDGISGNGGQVSIDSGNTNVGNAGLITLRAGASQNGNGGSIDLVVGSSTAGGTEGIITLKGEVYVTNRTGAGAGEITGIDAATGQNITVKGGDSTGGAGTGGVATLYGGFGAPGGVGGAAHVYGASGENGGGNIQIIAGTATITGNGGEVNISSGDATLGNAGNITLTTGITGGGGTDGMIMFVGSIGTDIAKRHTLTNPVQFGELILKSKSLQHVIVGGTQTETVAIQLPADVVVIGGQIVNITAIVSSGPVNYKVSYSTLADVIELAMTLGLGDDGGSLYDASSSTPLTPGITDILLDIGALQTFTSGTVEVIVYYYELTPIN